MSVINAAALIILGILVLRKLILMDRFFIVRTVLITTFLCGLLLLLFFLFLAGTELHCGNSYAPDVYFCP
ncbi:MAG TPA: hypothetical protein VE642_08230 [Pyrinomonadaceae bacterium]|nr:hypothetical protein [Pyrinomonadaceae bacterium]